MPFIKNHTVRSGANTVVKMCKRCNQHGIVIINKSGICSYCNSQIYLTTPRYKIFSVIDSKGKVSWI